MHVFICLSSFSFHRETLYELRSSFTDWVHLCCENDSKYRPFIPCLEFAFPSVCAPIEAGVEIMRNRGIEPATNRIRGSAPNLLRYKLAILFSSICYSCSPKWDQHQTDRMIARAGTRRDIKPPEDRMIGRGWTGRVG